MSESFSLLIHGVFSVRELHLRSPMDIVQDVWLADVFYLSSGLRLSVRAELFLELLAFI